MAKMVSLSRMLSMLIGLALVVGAVYAVFFVEWKTKEEEQERPVRPLKTLVVGDPFERIGRKYPGRVKAFQEVNFSFLVPGRLEHFPVKKGQRVKEGEELARIDPRDYVSALAAATARYAQTKTNLGRIEQAEKSGAVAGRELTNAQAQYETAEARMEIAAKAVEDTHLRAPFAGVVANTFVENFEYVGAQQPILSLQDVEETIQIEVSVPESRIALARSVQGEVVTFARFEYLPGKEYPVTLVEVATEADPLTQTYLVTFEMKTPDDALILPGMTATLQARWEEQTADDAGRFTIPVETALIDEAGAYYVWLVSQDGATMTVHRRDVEVEALTEDSAVVRQGLQTGDRIAAAGVHFLTEGQQVTQSVPKAEGGGM